LSAVVCWADADNYVEVYTATSASRRRWRVRSRVAGVDTDIADVLLGGAPLGVTSRVTVVSRQISSDAEHTSEHLLEVFVDGWPVIDQVNIPAVHASATRHGFRRNGAAASARVRNVVWRRQT
jgi:hypothetical protein